MHISETTVNRPVLAIVISLFLIILGLVSYDKLSIREYPDIDKPVITVSTIYRGASAEIMERDVTQILEDSISGISDMAPLNNSSRADNIANCPRESHFSIFSLELSIFKFLISISRASAIFSKTC